MYTRENEFAVALIAGPNLERLLFKLRNRLLCSPRFNWQLLRIYLFLLLRNRIMDIFIRHTKSLIPHKYKRFSRCCEHLRGTFVQKTQSELRVRPTRARALNAFRMRETLEDQSSLRRNAPVGSQHINRELSE